MSRMLGGVRLMVATAQLSDARVLLALRDSGELEAALNEQFPPVVNLCKQCGSTLFVQKRQGWMVLLAFMLLFMMNIIFPPGKRQRCSACGHLGEEG